MLTTLSEPLDLSIKRHEIPGSSTSTNKVSSNRPMSVSDDSPSKSQDCKATRTSVEPLDLSLVKLEISAAALTNPWTGLSQNPDEFAAQLAAIYKPQWRNDGGSCSTSPSFSRKSGEPGMETIRRSHSMPAADSTPESLDCLLCSSNFKAAEDLYNHMTVHSKHYRCQVCGKLYKQVRTYRAHLATHKSAKEFTCDLCNSVLPSSEEYLQHLKKHGRTDLHACTYCNKYFRDSGTLKAHVRIHTGDRPYKCDICGKAFRQTSTLRRHCRTHSCNQGEMVSM